MSAYKVKIDGKDETTSLKRVLKSIRVVDQEGITSDTATLVLVDKKDIAFPEVGKKIELSIEDNKQGIFIVDRVNASSQGTITITAKAFDYKKGLKVLRKVSWDEDLRSVASKIANKHGLKSAIGKVASSILIKEVQNESDLSFLTRIANEHSLLFKIDSDHLLITRKGTSFDAKGQMIPKYTLKEVFSWTYSNSLTLVYTGLRTYFTDKNSGERIEISIGDTSNQYIHDLTWGDKDEAEKQADKKLREIKRPKKALTIVGPYMPVVCGQKVEIKDVRVGINGTWSTQSVEHQVNPTGVKTTLRLGGI